MAFAGGGDSRLQDEKMAGMKRFGKVAREFREINPQLSSHCDERLISVIKKAAAEFLTSPASVCTRHARA